MSIEDRTKAAAKNIEGKGQEVVGAVTGNSQDELAGKAKQAEGKVRDGIEDLKDKTDNLGDKAKHAAEQARDGLEDAACNPISLGCWISFFNLIKIYHLFYLRSHQTIPQRQLN